MVAGMMKQLPKLKKFNKPASAGFLLFLPLKFNFYEILVLR
jgi:hypothetical protein